LIKCVNNGTRPENTPFPRRGAIDSVEANRAPKGMQTSEQRAEVATDCTAAALLHAADDVATALADLASGTVVRTALGERVHEVQLVEDVAIGHKFALYDLAAGLRIRKYGEYIGRTTADVVRGAWVHVHNVATGAQRGGDDLFAWCEQAEAPANIRPVGPSRSSAGASPLWDAASNRLYWIDAHPPPAIHAIHLATGLSRRWPLNEEIGAVVLAGRERLLAALPAGFAFVMLDTGALVPFVGAGPTRPAQRTTDAKCDPLGRLWCSRAEPESRVAAGEIHVLDGRGEYRRGLDGFVAPGGLAWSLDGRTMYVADTRRGIIYAFAYDVATGTPGARRVFADVGALPGGPAGATVDAEDHLWSAQWDAGCVIRYDPDGRMDRVIRLPVTRPTACAFGGTDHGQLYVTSTAGDPGAGRRSAEPLAGQVLTLDVGVAGVAPVAFSARTDSGVPA
jgi:sugar lactone lactonase YvrE